MTVTGFVFVVVMSLALSAAVAAVVVVPAAMFGIRVSVRSQSLMVSWGGVLVVAAAAVKHIVN